MTITPSSIYKMSTYLKQILTSNSVTVKYYAYACVKHDEHMAFTNMKVTMVSFSDLMLYLVQILAVKLWANDYIILSPSVLICTTVRIAHKSVVRMK